MFTLVSHCVLSKHVSLAFVLLLSDTVIVIDITQLRSGLIHDSRNGHCSLKNVPQKPV